jgi:hypothetical protein
MLQALADGETDPATLASLADTRLRATAAQLSDAFGACTTLHPVYRRLLKLTLDELRLIEDHLGQLDQQMADLLTAHHDAVQRLAEVPGLGVDSAQQIIEDKYRLCYVRGPAGIIVALAEELATAGAR